MRELFDEVAGQSPLDPEEAVRRTTRGPRRKRFYTKAGVVEGPDGFAIVLDDKPVRTPSGRALAAPIPEIADAVAAEWGAQKEFIDPLAKIIVRDPRTYLLDGRIDDPDSMLLRRFDLLKQALEGGAAYRRVYACGPLPMFRALAPLLAAASLEGSFAMESEMACGFGVCLGCVVPTRERPDGPIDYKRVCVEGPVMRAEDLGW